MTKEMAAKRWDCQLYSEQQLWGTKDLELFEPLHFLE